MPVILSADNKGKYHITLQFIGKYKGKTQWDRYIALCGKTGVDSIPVPLSYDKVTEQYLNLLYNLNNSICYSALEA